MLSSAKDTVIPAIIYMLCIIFENLISIISFYMLKLNPNNFIKEIK